ncbi:sensor histidine kinase [Raineyella fluvialis]|uniref:histidine kinase n=1 Tax=Raineyella fluvialis TaxID=2662261 RepID=A0A5Q2FDA8_9ACTN|nr:sensor histidine kinase [Raineyella fluvialis]QGF23767.1 hypothetical protein Rai3103_08875 [Raineyella fluvialis]
MELRPGLPASGPDSPDGRFHARHRAITAVVSAVVVAWLMLVAALPSTAQRSMRSHMRGQSMMPGRYDPYDPRYPDPTGPWAQALVESPWLPLLVGACVAVGVGLLLRYVRPRLAYVLVLAGVTAYLLAGGSLPFALPAPAIALVALSGSRPGRSWTAWVLALVPMLWAVGWRQPYLGLTSAWLYPAIIFGFAAILVPTLISEMRRSQVSVRRQAHEEEMQRVAYQERLRLAQDLHDVVGHSLSTISLQAGVALRFLDDDPAQARASLEAIRTSAKDSLTDVRRTLGILRDPEEAAPLAPGPTLDRLDDLVAPLIAGGAAITLHRTPGLVAGVPTPVQQVAYRIIQEGLTNAVRHAPGTPVDITIGRSGDRLRIEVRNGGPAPAHRIVEGNGLRGMRERVATLGGVLTIDDAGPGGVAIRADLPLGRTATPGSVTPTSAAPWQV